MFANKFNIMVEFWYSWRYIVCNKLEFRLDLVFVKNLLSKYKNELLEKGLSHFLDLKETLFLKFWSS